MGDQWGSNPSYGGGYSAGGNRGYNNERRNYGGGGGGGRDQGGGSRYFNRSFDGGDRNRGDFRNNRTSGGGGGGGGGSFNNRNFDDADATTIKVPTKFVGRIIGRGGSKINDLQYKSGARIQVTKDTEGDDTFVKLFGNSGAVSTAQDLIGELTVDY